MKSFDDVKEVKLEDSDRNALDVLSRSRGWARVEKIVEDYILQLTHNLVVGTELERGKRAEELEKLAGFSYYWLKVKKLVNNPVKQNEETESK